MPELPEVETVRSRLAPDIERRTIVRARIDDPRLVRPELPATIGAALVGLRIERVLRRGKYLLLRFSDGETMAVHLRMTGNVLRRVAGAEPPKALRAELELDDGSLVAYTDLRRFGTWELFRDEASIDEFLAQRLGPEPFSEGFSPAFLYGAVHRRASPLKAVLLDQRVVAGLGNIYADESLWAAKIHPEL
ncbi:MAG: DNA-formamidopyrimidine glycosylase family protein, partial [Gaiellales bacterium]